MHPFFFSQCSIFPLLIIPYEPAEKGVAKSVNVKGWNKVQTEIYLLCRCRNHSTNSSIKYSKNTIILALISAWIGLLGGKGINKSSLFLLPRFLTVAVCELTAPEDNTRASGSAVCNATCKTLRLAKCHQTHLVQLKSTVNGQCFLLKKDLEELNCQCRGSLFVFLREMYSTLIRCNSDCPPFPWP